MSYETPLLSVPPGYKLVETDEKVTVLTHTYTKKGTERVKRNFPPGHLGYRYEVEQVTRNPFTFNRWAVVAYQNVLEKIDG
jgi:hypothetical protein